MAKTLYVRFERDDGSVSMVGMNDLFIITDARLTTIPGIAKRIYSMCEKYHPAKLNRFYKVYDKNGIFLFRGVSKVNAPERTTK